MWAREADGRPPRAAARRHRERCPSAHRRGQAGPGVWLAAPGLRSRCSRTGSNLDPTRPSTATGAAVQRAGFIRQYAAAAQILGRSVSRTRQLAASDRIPASRDSPGRYWFRPDQLQLARQARRVTEKKRPPIAGSAVEAGGTGDAVSAWSARLGQGEFCRGRGVRQAHQWDIRPGQQWLAWSLPVSDTCRRRCGRRFAVTPRGCTVGRCDGGGKGAGEPGRRCRAPKRCTSQSPGISPGTIVRTEVPAGPPRRTASRVC
jgi:hypothetical protein